MSVMPIKLVVVGDRNVGKTSILFRLAFPHLAILKIHLLLIMYQLFLIIMLLL